MIRGVPRFDGIALGEFTVNFMSTALKFEAKAAFIHSTSGNTHGFTTHTTWSPETIAKLQELRALMEIDLGNVHLVGGGGSVTAPQGFSPPTQAESGGLGEFLGSDG